MVHGLLAPVKHNIHGGYNVCNLPLVAPWADQLCTILTSPNDSGRGILERIRRVGERQQHITSNPLVGFGLASPLHPRTAAFRYPHPSTIRPHTGLLGLKVFAFPLMHRSDMAIYGLSRHCANQLSLVRHCPILP